jgi:hypothetical protein
MVKIKGKNNMFKFLRKRFQRDLRPFSFVEDEVSVRCVRDHGLYFEECIKPISFRIYGLTFQYRWIGSQNIVAAWRAYYVYISRSKDEICVREKVLQDLKFFRENI